MFLPIVLTFIASTFALPALELPVPPEVLVVVTSEKELDRIQPNTRRPLMNTNEHIEIIEKHSNINEIKEEERRIFEEERRIIEEEKRIIDEEKRIIEEKRLIDEKESKIIEEEKRIIEEEKRIIEEEEKRIIEEEEKRIIEEEEKRITEEEEKRLIEEEKQMMGEVQERKIVLPAVPSPPELPPVDESIFTTFLRANKLEESQDASKDVKPYIHMWKLPRIIFPGRYLIDNIYGPHITLGV